MASVKESFKEAYALHQAGQLDRAELLYRNILRLDPEHAETLHLLGVAAHQRGRNDDAVEFIAKAIEIHGPAASALNNLGTALRELGRLDEAIDAFRQAVSIAPAFAGAHFNLALALEAAGEIRQAVDHYEQTLSCDSRFLNAYIRLGLLSAAGHRFEEAIECFENALRENCRFVPAHLCLAETYHSLGRLEAAADRYRQVLRMDPKNISARQQWEQICAAPGVETQSLLTAVEEIKQRIGLHPDDTALGFEYADKLEQLCRYDEAEQEYRRVVTINPAYGEAHLRLADLLFDQGKLVEAAEHYHLAAKCLPSNEVVLLKRANVLMDLERFDEAVQSYRRAVKSNPHYVAGWYNLGNALREAEEYQEAETCYRTALNLNTAHSKARCNLGVVLRNQGRLEESWDCWEEILKSSPGHSQAQLQQALTLLAMGDFAQGWDEYESRWRAEVRPRSFPEPMWNGESLQGKRILIHAEQGVGDEIMFASCIPDVLKQAEQCCIECDTRLVPLFRRSFGGTQIVSRPINRDVKSDEAPADFNFQIPMGSLPRMLRRSADSFPAREQYLLPDSGHVRKWRERFAERGEGFQVGISWRGGKKPDVRRSRSTSLDQWKPVFSLPGVCFVNLQYGDCREELASCREDCGISIHDWDEADPLTDLDGFAAQLAALDLVISVDNATVHMAGAVGVPVWTLLPFAADFRWMRETEITPWYPSMRLFRQPQPRDWESVFAQVSKKLQSCS